MNIKSLHIYPIKSLGGISLNESKLTSRGLYLDRRYMLVDEGFKFLTQREHPQMALFNLRIQDDLILVDYQKQEGAGISFSINEIGNPLTQSVEVWDSKVTASNVSKYLDDWFSKQLGIKCHLVYMPDDSIRPVKPKYIKNEIVSFADGYPFLFTNTASLAMLNEKLEHPVSMDRFRANIVVEGKTAFEEDEWTVFKISNHQFTTPKKCGRCQVVNIDPKTGLYTKEVLKTLSTFRKEGNKVLFGMNGCWLNKMDEDAIIRVGDTLEFEI